METQIELNQGEIKLNLRENSIGKLTFADLGLKNEDLALDGGLLRLVIDISGVGEHAYFKMPTVEVAYAEEVAETHWVCEFNGETILDKTDHHGHSTVLLLDRTKLSGLEHHHVNKLIVHAEFPQPVHLSAEESYINLFK